MMKRIGVLLVLCAAILAVSTGHAPRKPLTPSPPEAAQPNADLQSVRRAVANLASGVHELQGFSARTGSDAQASVANMWSEIIRLKREGQNVRAIESYVSDLEGSLRSGRQGAAARQHIVNNLNYEVERLKRQQR